MKWSWKLPTYVYEGALNDRIPVQERLKEAEAYLDKLYGDREQLWKDRSETVELCVAALQDSGHPTLAKLLRMKLIGK